MVDFIDALPEYDIALYTHKKMKTNPENSLESLKEVLPVLEALRIGQRKISMTHSLTLSASLA